MSNRNITVNIDPMGTVKIEANNFAGASCQSATEPLEKALAGGSGRTEVLKPEFYQEAEAEAQQNITQW